MQFCRWNIAQRKQHGEGAAVLHQVAVIKEKIHILLQCVQVILHILDEHIDGSLPGGKIHSFQALTKLCITKSTAKALPEQTHIRRVYIDAENRIALFLPLVQKPKCRRTFTVTHRGDDGGDNIFLNVPQGFLHTLGNIYSIDAFCVSWHKNLLFARVNGYYIVHCLPILSFILSFWRTFQKSGKVSLNILVPTDVFILLYNNYTIKSNTTIPLPLTGNIFTDAVDSCDETRLQYQSFFPTCPII